MQTKKITDKIICNLSFKCFYLLMQACKGSKHTVTIPLEFKYIYFLFQNLKLKSKALVHTQNNNINSKYITVTSGLSWSTCSRTKHSESPFLKEPSYFITKFLPLYKQIGLQIKPITPEFQMTEGMHNLKKHTETTLPHLTLTQIAPASSFHCWHDVNEHLHEDLRKQRSMYQN